MIASIGDLYRYRELLWTLVYRDLRSRTKGSLLGYAWIVLQPLLATGFFTLLIREGVLGIQPTQDIPYPIFLFSGMILWSYFSGSLSAATERLTEHSDLLRHVNFPREVLVLYPWVARFIDLGINLLVLAGICWMSPVGFQMGILLAPLAIGPVVLFGYGVALVLAPLHVAARDVGKAVPWLLSFAIYATPVLYPLERVPSHWRIPYLVNPVAGVVEGFRGLSLYGRISDPTALAMAWIVSLAVWWCGQWLFDHFEQALSDVV